MKVKVVNIKTNQETEYTVKIYSNCKGMFFECNDDTIYISSKQLEKLQAKDDFTQLDMNRFINQEVMALVSDIANIDDNFSDYRIMIMEDNPKVQFDEDMRVVVICKTTNKIDEYKIKLGKVEDGMFEIKDNFIIVDCGSDDIDLNGLFNNHIVKMLMKKMNIGERNPDEYEFGLYSAANSLQK